MGPERKGLSGISARLPFPPLAHLFWILNFAIWIKSLDYLMAPDRLSGIIAQLPQTLANLFFASITTVLVKTL